MDITTRALLASQAAQLEAQATAFAAQAASLREAIELADTRTVAGHAAKAFTVGEVATMLGLGESTVKAMVAAKTIPSVLFGNSRRILADDLDRYLLTTKQAG